MQKLCSFRFVSVRLDSVRFFAIRFGSSRFVSLRLGSIRNRLISVYEYGPRAGSTSRVHETGPGAGSTSWVQEGMMMDTDADDLGGLSLQGTRGGRTALAIALLCAHTNYTMAKDTQTLCLVPRREARR